MYNRTFNKLFIDENNKIYTSASIENAGNFLRPLSKEEYNITEINNNSLIPISSHLSCLFFLDKSIPKIPLDSWIRVLYLFEFFLSINYEVCIHLYFQSPSQNFTDSQSNPSCWKFLLPQQSVHSSFVNTKQFLLCDIISGQESNPSKLKPFFRVGDSHLHPMPLHSFSSTDDHNELNLNGFHILVSTSNKYYTSSNPKSVPYYSKLEKLSLEDINNENNLSPFNSILSQFPFFYHLGSFTFKGLRYYFNFTESLIDFNSSFDSSLTFEINSSLYSHNKQLSTFLETKKQKNVFFNPLIFNLISFN
ncbi:hypothetical protein V6O07_22630 [Arthrospira platensis SPKY2]